MRLPKFFFITIMLTFLSLAYVWQQTEIVSLGYEGQRNLSKFQELLDENSSLRYCLTKNTSLVKIGNKVSNNKDFQMPDNYYLVRLAVDKSNPRIARNTYSKKQNFVSQIFSVKREAVAKTIKPSNPLAQSSIDKITD